MYATGLNLLSLKALINNKVRTLQVWFQKFLQVSLRSKDFAAHPITKKKKEKKKHQHEHEQLLMKFQQIMWYLQLSKEVTSKLTTYTKLNKRPRN